MGLEMEKIILCIKGVPKPGTVKVDPKTHTLKRESLELILNPPDRQAIEMTARLKETYGFKVYVITMGPPNVIPLLKEVYGIVADEMVLLSDRAFAGSDTLATSYVLAQAIKRLSPYSLVLMGLKSIDGETSQVPPETAALLELPSLTHVKAIYKEENSWVVIRQTEYGEEELEVNPPFVASILPEAFDYLRPPSLKRLLEAKVKEPMVLAANDLDLIPERLGLNGSPTQVVDVFEKKIEIKGQVIEGDPSFLVEKLVSVLEQKGIINP
ncbi:electron transfer flavoprotein subunit beta/FixA family protein [Thermodesulfobacterium sp. TA1]|nr:electron transfer flavoprotein subunit beta/FixA family protein [Thermodesulfobacterium sp. TA1]